MSLPLTRENNPFHGGTSRKRKFGVENLDNLPEVLPGVGMRQSQTFDTFTNAPELQKEQAMHPVTRPPIYPRKSPANDATSGQKSEKSEKSGCVRSRRVLMITGDEGESTMYQQWLRTGVISSYNIDNDN